MSKLHWDEVGTRFYEAGVQKGVLYFQDGRGEAWDGLISVKESEESNSEPSYFEGVRMRPEQELGQFQMSVSAFTYPERLDDVIFSPMEGSVKGFCYRTESRNDLGDVGYKIHIIYNSLFVPSGKDYSTLTNSTDPIIFTWEVATKAVRSSLAGPTAHFIIDTRTIYSWTLEALEDVLYGTDEVDAYLPSLDELLEIFEEESILRIIDHGDGTWTAIGPDDVVYMLDETTFEITWPSAIYIAEDTYKISSL